MSLYGDCPICGKAFPPPNSAAHECDLARLPGLADAVQLERGMRAIHARRDQVEENRKELAVLRSSLEKLTGVVRNLASILDDLGKIARRKDKPQPPPNITLRESDEGTGK